MVVLLQGQYDEICPNLVLIAPIGAITFWRFTVSFEKYLIAPIGAINRTTDSIPLLRHNKFNNQFNNQFNNHNEYLPNTTHNKEDNKMT